MSGIPLGIMASSISVVAGVSGATTFTVDTPDEGFAQQLGSFFMKFANAGSISVFSEEREIGTTINYPANMADDDVAVLFQCSFNNTSNSLPTKVIPTGFTEIDDITLDTGNEFRVVSAYKKALSTDSSTTITGMNAESDVKFLFIIRGTSNPTVSVGSTNKESSTGSDISSQTVTLPSNSDSSDTEPIMVFAVKQSRNDDPLNDFAGLTGSDGFTNELYRQSQSSRDANRVGYYLNNNGRYQSDTNVPVEEIILYCPFNDSTGVASNATVYLSDAGSRTFTSTTSFWSAQAASTGITASSSTTPQIIAATSLLNVGASPPLPMGYTTCYNGGGTGACIVDTSSGSPSGTWLDNIAQGSFNTLSIEFYFYIATNTQTSNFSRIMSWGDYYANGSTSGQGFALEFNGTSDDDFQAHVYDTGSSASRQTLVASNLSLSDWHYFYSSVDVVNEECHIRIDNTSTTISTSLLGSTWTPYSSPLRFGQHSASRGFNGGIAELVIRVNEGVYGGPYRGKTFLNGFITS